MAQLSRASKLFKKNIEQVAEQPAARIKARMDSIHTQLELSMASLKGYLMSDKMWPFQAVDDIELWVEDTREGHDRRPVGVAADKTRPHESHLLDLQGSLLCQIASDSSERFRRTTRSREMGLLLHAVEDEMLCSSLMPESDNKLK
jgi:hypothetical protein